jgi:peptide/nickel transport system ATP-binding protein
VSIAVESARPAPPAVEVSGLRKTYGNLVAVDDLSFSIAPGESLGLVGESGSGKTTAARMLVGLVRPDAGELRLGGRLPARGRAATRRSERLARGREVQMVFQDPYLSLDPRVSVEQCLVEVLRLHTKLDRAGRDRRVAALLDQVGLGQRERRALPRQLSGGQRQRVAIARALATEPRLLVLDEAVAALDVSTQAQILNLLGDVRRDTGVSYLFVSHDLAVVRYVTDRLLVLYRGTAVEAGSTERVLSAPEHPYTRLLLQSIPHKGWDPSRISALRRELAAAQ